ncbi:hypothetical protein CLQ_13883 (plasmid) [Clostridium botulinum Af84]|uniref:hypothetical protein n=1 Tax=Clostridium botulinum TaxID=1491 RepID=UPI00035BA9FD|nr:hypothetical protein [Clostridium botulinum]APR02758.1 hypothetical protein RSJ2_3641 [Clostridium botulinum]AUN19694.1 hypothetical protein B2M06_19230 [Clostridium botulinum]EPS54382.1 hypothetical protein CLQ_13883 [Clostridium botulinum Af84]NFM83727.1 hypothetical protein [Clostridium botulinum]NFP09999.1 hypothetical protein [Clostridium botulinum]
MFYSPFEFFIFAILDIILLPITIPMNLFYGFKIKKRNKKSITVKELLSQIDSEIIAKDILKILIDYKETELYGDQLNKFINNTDLLMNNIQKIKDTSKQKNTHNTNNHIITLASSWYSLSLIDLCRLLPYRIESEDKSILFILNVKIDVDVYKELTKNEVLAYIFLDYLLGA